jgi:hypothetical protein
MQPIPNNKMKDDARRKTEDARRRPNYGPSSSYTPASDVGYQVPDIDRSAGYGGDSGGDSGGCGGGGGD